MQIFKNRQGLYSKSYQYIQDLKENMALMREQMKKNGREMEIIFK